MELILATFPLVAALVIVALVLLFFLPFFVFRIRNELIELNRIQRRMLVLLEAVVPESKKPKTKACPVCRTLNEVGSRKCAHCGDPLPE
jgi:hypothetical protein